MHPQGTRPPRYGAPDFRSRSAACHLLPQRLRPHHLSPYAPPPKEGQSDDDEYVALVWAVKLGDDTDGYDADEFFYCYKARADPTAPTSDELIKLTGNLAQALLDVGNDSQLLLRRPKAAPRAKFRSAKSSS